MFFTQKFNIFAIKQNFKNLPHSSVHNALGLNWYQRYKNWKSPDEQNLAQRDGSLILQLYFNEAGTVCSCRAAGRDKTHYVLDILELKNIYGLVRL